MANLHSWILWLHTILMGPSQLKSIERWHMRTNILISNPTTSWPKRLQSLEHSFLGLSHVHINYVADQDQEVSHVTKAVKWNGYPRSATEISHPPKQQANREMVLCIGFFVLTATWHLLAKQDIPSRSTGKKKKHLRALSNADLQTSALAEHALTYHNDVIWNNPEVLDSNVRTKNVP